jgi:putative toxin-antitoxin system antitoxin component (TIGR02293 family)
MVEKHLYPPGLAERASAFGAASTRVEPAALAELWSHGYSEDEIFALVVPKRTLARRKAANEPLTVEETDKALRLVRIAVQAERAFGDVGKAQRWLRKAKRELKGETPVAYLASEAGARAVEEMLFRIEHGIHA